MGFDSLRAALERRFRERWNQTPVEWPNSRYDPSDGQPWVRHNVLTGESLLAGLGTTGLYRTSGVVELQIFVPVGQGAGEAMRLADLAAEIWRGARIDKAVMRAPSLVPAGETGDGWWQVNVSTPFYWDESF